MAVRPNEWHCLSINNHEVLCCFIPPDFRKFYANPSYFINAKAIEGNSKMFRVNIFAKIHILIIYIDISIILCIE